jgi:DNA-binding transcriptional ArsR family regulator
MNTDTPDVADDYSGGDRGISPQLDATLELLSNQRRRYVLYYLREQGNPVPVAELADRVTTWENDSSADRSRVLSDLHHSQLPRLDEAGVVDFDAEEGYVSLATDAEAPITEYLDLAASEENLV